MDFTTAGTIFIAVIGYALWLLTAYKLKRLAESNDVAVRIWKESLSKSIYTTMSLEDIQKLICRIIACKMEIISYTDINKVDPQAHDKLMSSVVLETISFFSADDRKVIESRFGANFMLNFINMNMKILINRKVIQESVRQNILSSDIYRELTMYNGLK